MHAENADLVGRPPVGRGWRDWCESRPVVAELEAISRAILFAEETRCALHVVYLVLGEEDLEALGAVAKCAPPLRAAADREQLRAELAAVDLIASDHSPAPPSLKQGDDAFAIWGGISGCQSLLPLVLTEGPARRARDVAGRRAVPRRT